MLYKKGVNLVEIIMATTVFSIVVFTFVTALSYGMESIVFAGDRNKATFLAEEGLEAVRNIKDSDFDNLSDGTYGIDDDGSVWSLSGSSDVNGGFTREVVLTELSPEVYEVESTVTWDQSALRPGEVSIVSRLSNWVVSTVVGIGDWSIPLLDSENSFPGSGNGWKIDVVDDYAYLVMRNSSPDFFVVDVSDTLNPVTVSSLSVTGSLRDIKVSNGYAYIASTSNGSEILVYDVSNPSSPFLVDTLNLPGNDNAWAIEVDQSGNRLYVVRQSGSDDFVVVDISDPTDLDVIADTNIVDSARDLYINGNFAFVGGTSNSQDVVVVYIGFPTFVFLTATANIPGNADIDTITGFDNYLILGDSSGFVKIYDISNPYAPSFVSSIDVDDDVNDFMLGNNNQYLWLGSDENSGEVQILDITDVNNPSILGVYNLDGDINGVFYDGDKDRFFGVGENNSQELVILRPS
jgi:hypothetical protein